jgi:hypothetical protein
MLLVVFGAGASYDSFHLVPAPTPSDNGPLTPKQLYWEERPPLANQLFDSRPIFVDLMEQFKDCQAIVPLLQQPGVSVEKKLAEFQGQATTYPPVNRELNAIRFYLHFAIGKCQDQWRYKHRGSTNFTTLLREIERWRLERNERVCFVTFNYDTMLEEAMSQFLRLNVRDMSSYITWNDYSLFKLHGSVNWAREVDGFKHPGNNVPFPYQNLIDAVTPSSSHLTNTYQICNREMWPTLGHAVLFPAISIPVENKDEFVCPAAHVEALQEALREVTKVITIGWRATETDFLENLKLHRPHFREGAPLSLRKLIISGDDAGAQETQQNLARFDMTPDPFENPAQERFASGFSGLIKDLGKLNTFLRA